MSRELLDGFRRDEPETAEQKLKSFIDSFSKEEAEWAYLIFSDLIEQADRMGFHES